MKEVKTAQKSDSGQESEEDDEQKEDKRRNAIGKSREGRLIKGTS